MVGGGATPASPFPSLNKLVGKAVAARFSASSIRSGRHGGRWWDLELHFVDGSFLDRSKLLLEISGPILAGVRGGQTVGASGLGCSLMLL